MAHFLVERNLAGITTDELQAAARSAKDASARMRQEGLDVSYLRSTFLPEDERCFCLFESQNADLVIEANRRALLPFEKVHGATHIAADDLT